MYGHGIGPVLREQHRKLAARVLNASVDVITLGSRTLKELQSMGVTKPEILLTADPAPDPRRQRGRDRQRSVMGGHPRPTGSTLCFALRNWKGFETRPPVRAGGEIRLRDLRSDAGVRRRGKASGPGRAGRLAATGLDIPTIFWMMLAAADIIGALSDAGRGVHAAPRADSPPDRASLWRAWCMTQRSPLSCGISVRRTS